MVDSRPITPGDTIGILGGGQLARMLAIAAAQLGLKCHIYAPDGDNPAFEVAGAFTTGDYRDTERLAAFASAVAVVTYEFENVPAEAVAAIEPICPVRPNGRSLTVTQDRLFEKQFLRDLGLATAPFQAVDSAEALAQAATALGLPGILKTRRFGYDGKGQISLRTKPDVATGFAELNQPAILEGFVPFSREISVIAARGLDGAFRAFDPCENRHKNGILSQTTVPASVTDATARAAQIMAQQIADALDYVGVLGLELFVVGNGVDERLVVNEIAPRVHNSGHWTIEGAATSQFTQHIRAICGWPLGSTRRFGRVTMENLIGDEALAWQEHLGRPGAALHLYGKAAIRAGRKMGHVTQVLPEN